MTAIADPERPETGRDLMAVATPALVLDAAKLQANIERMRAHLARWPDVTLRPHMKTAKSLEIARRVRPDHGPITVSTLREAEVFGAEGFRDVTYAVGIGPDKLVRAAALNRHGVRTGVILDSEAAAHAVAEVSRSYRTALPALIEIDTDGHRGGVRPDDPAVARIGAILARAGALEGVLTHAGGSYGAGSTDEIAQFAARERAGALAARDQLRGAGLPCPVVSIGSTPTVLFAQDLSEITEVRAGVYMFQDLVMAGLGVCRVDEIALTVLATVIGHQPDRGRLIIDAGWMALSRDRGSAAGGRDMGFGQVTDVEGRPLELIVAATNQEHGVVARADGEPIDLGRYPIGARLRVLPNHACATAAQHARYVVVEDQRVAAVWPRFGQW